LLQPQQVVDSIFAHGGGDLRVVALIASYVNFRLISADKQLLPAGKRVP
jgi:hypothetical protein